MNQELQRRRWYDAEECNFTEAVDLRIDHRLSRIEEDVVDLETRQKSSEELLKEIHETVCKSKHVLTGFRLGALSVIGVIAIALTVFTGFFTGKISLAEIFKIIMG